MMDLLGSQADWLTAKNQIPSMLLTDRNKFPSFSVIYFVWNGDRLLYIGQTKNLCSRFKVHHRIAEFLQAGLDTRVSWFRVALDELRNCEKTLIDTLKPEINFSAQISSKERRLKVKVLLSDNTRKISSRVQDEETGRFVKKSTEETLVRKQIWVDQQHLNQIEQQLAEKQSFSSFVRDAIAYYLSHHPTT